MQAALKKHELSAKVEAVSGGKQVVLQTAKGQPTYMNMVKAFDLEDGTGPHPAFIINGVQVSEIYIGTYQAVIRDGEALSLPGEDPEVNVNFDTAHQACLNAGAGHHLITNWEWAAIAIWCASNGHGQLRGNTSFGQNHAVPDEKGTISKDGRTLTGSGPASWRHDGTEHGIADLVGNVWEWVDGLKLVEGKVLMAPDNNFQLPESEWPDTGSRICFGNGLQLSDSIMRRRWASEAFSHVTIKDGYTASSVLQHALLLPTPGQDLAGRFWADNRKGEECLPLRGGCWGSESDAGLAALALLCGRSASDPALGFRPAFAAI